jgi:hypothetical protein
MGITRSITEPETILQRIDPMRLDRMLLEKANKVLFRLGLPVFSLAIIALGIETFVCAHRVIFLDPLESNPRFEVIPVLPFLPAIPWLAYLFGAVLAACGIGLLLQRYMRISSAMVGSLLFLSTLLLEVPKYAEVPGSMSLRTVVFEPLAMATIAWLLPGARALPSFLERASRYMLAVSFIVFGVDHFLALAPIGTLLPNWIPWHAFWIGFFGGGFIAAGLSLALGVLVRWAAACVGLMFAIWVFTLHLPRVLGLYGIPGAPHSPAEWSSLFIAVALWGGSWALARSHIPSLLSRTRNPT